MRMDPTRKCSKFGNVQKFADSGPSKMEFKPPKVGFGPSNSSFGHSNFRFSHRLALIQAHGDWAQEWLNQGWDGYLVTFMFNQLPGSRRAMVHQMHQQLERWYGRLATRTIRKTRSPVWVPFLPKGIFVPDLPVPKRSKLGIRDVSINDGLHMHGIVVANRWARIPETLDVYFEENLKTYLTNKLRHIDVQRITHRTEYTTGYGMKGLKRPAFSEDDILVLPRALSELPGRKLSSVSNVPSKRAGCWRCGSPPPIWLLLCACGRPSLGACSAIPRPQRRSASVVRPGPRRPQHTCRAACRSQHRVSSPEPQSPAKAKPQSRQAPARRRPAEHLGAPASGGALATKYAPRLVAAPGLFSTTIGWSMSSDSFCPTQPREEIGFTPRRIRDDQMGRLGGIVLRRGAGAHARRGLKSKKLMVDPLRQCAGVVAIRNCPLPPEIACTPCTPCLTH